MNCNNGCGGIDDSLLFFFLLLVVLFCGGFGNHCGAGSCTTCTSC